MPTYVYACPTCGHRFDAVQAMSDEPLTSCPECANPLRKVFGTVGVTFKGSGFYRTDSRPRRDSGGALAQPKSESKPGSKPHAKPTAPTTPSSGSPA